MKQRYEPLHAHIELVNDSVLRDDLETAMNRANSQRFRKIIRAHDEAIDVGYNYTILQIANIIGLTPRQISSVKQNNHILDSLFRAEQTTAHSIHYRKNGNWYLNRTDAAIDEESEDEDVPDDEP